MESDVFLTGQQKLPSRNAFSIISRKNKKGFDQHQILSLFFTDDIKGIGTFILSSNEVKLLG
jgi:hypothetical protein